MTRYLVDLFCGMGGISTGFARAGFQVYAAVDCWQDALEAHALNHPECKHVNLQLGTPESVREVMVLLPKLTKNDHLHVHASPPCQNLSLVNAKRKEEIGLGLTAWTLDLLINIKRTIPSMTFTVEQVANKKVLDYLNEKHSNLFYGKINMNEYGVPQSRTRIIVASLGLCLEKKKPPLLRDVIKVPRGTAFIGAPAYSYEKYLAGTSSFLRFKKYTKDVVPYTVVSRTPSFVGKDMKVIRDFSKTDLMLLQGFNEDYFGERIDVKNSQNRKIMVANSVPVQFAECMANGILNALSIKPVV